MQGFLRAQVGIKCGSKVCLIIGQFEFEFKYKYKLISN